MDVFIYQGDLLCEDCGNEMRSQLDAEGDRPFNIADEGSYDSDEYPKGPYSDGGGEADCPQHCGFCHVFLENPLTSDGAQYVLDRATESRSIPREWREEYAYLFPA